MTPFYPCDANVTKSMRLRSALLMHTQKLLAKPKVMPLDAAHSIAYVEAGSGRPIVFVHGSLCDYRYWQPQLSDLPTDFRVICPSLSHYYPRLPSAAATPFSWELHVEQIASFIRRVGSGPVHLVGHSRGACIAYQVALRNPEYIESLTLVDAAGPTQREAHGSADPPELRALRVGAVELIAAGLIDQGLKMFVDSTSRPGFWERSAAVFQGMARDNAGTLAPQLHDALPLYLPRDAMTIDCPVLLIDGDRSPAMYRQNTHYLSTLIATARRTTITGASHGMTWSHPQVFNRELREFVFGIAQRAPEP